MGIIERIKRHFAIKSYVKKLGPVMKMRYGKSKSYTAPQIEKSVRAAGLNAAYICYGYGMFLAEGPFINIHQEMGETCDYHAIRQEIADKCFDGNQDFSYSDAISAGYDHGGGLSEMGGDGGNFGGGGDVGGSGDGN